MDESESPQKVFFGPRQPAEAAFADDLAGLQTPARPRRLFLRPNDPDPENDSQSFDHSHDDADADASRVEDQSPTAGPSRITRSTATSPSTDNPLVLVPTEEAERQEAQTTSEATERQEEKQQSEKGKEKEEEQDLSFSTPDSANVSVRRSSRPRKPSARGSPRPLTAEHSPPPTPTPAGKRFIIHPSPDSSPRSSRPSHPTRSPNSVNVSETSREEAQENIYSPPHTRSHSPQPSPPKEDPAVSPAGTSTRPDDSQGQDNPSPPPAAPSTPPRSNEKQILHSPQNNDSVSPAEEGSSPPPTTPPQGFRRSKRKSASGADLSSSPYRSSDPLALKGEFKEDEEDIAEPQVAENPSPEPITTQQASESFESAHPAPASGRSRRRVSNETPPRPPTKKQQKKKEPNPALEEAKALMKLTTANTNLNNGHIANLERRTIRKEGKRPESPSSKVRTVAQRRKEEKERARVERAQRRAGQKDSSLIEEGDSFLDENKEKTPPGKHARGPGEEDDYTTPAKPRKRRRRDSDPEAEEDDQEGADENEKPQKSVKWDKGLQRMINLDDVEVGSAKKKRKLEPAAGKSCLAPEAKALQLDTMGNIADAGRPLPDLEKETIVVTRFQYDDDEPPPKPPPPRATRKGRKK